MQKSEFFMGQRDGVLSMRGRVESGWQGRWRMGCVFP